MRWCACPSCLARQGAANNALDMGMPILKMGSRGNSKGLLPARPNGATNIWSSSGTPAQDTTSKK
eukprot:15380641-Alexandrium_andersonii.AAC.1